MLAVCIPVLLASPNASLCSCSRMRGGKFEFGAEAAQERKKKNGKNGLHAASKRQGARRDSGVNWMAHSVSMCVCAPAARPASLLAARGIRRAEPDRGGGTALWAPCAPSVFAFCVCVRSSLMCAPRLRCRCVRLLVCGAWRAVRSADGANEQSRMRTFT